jgi:hypothetical protein
MPERVARNEFPKCECVSQGLIQRDTWLLFWGGQAGDASLAKQASVLPSPTPQSPKTKPPCSSLLRLWLNRRLSAGLGIKLVDFAS